GAAPAPPDGNWTAVFGSSLPDGSHTYTVRQVDVAGNTSADSPAITFTVDRSAPGVPSGTPDLAAASDSGASNTDNITNEREPTFTGSGALANTGVALFANGVEIGRTTANPSGNWSFTVPPAKALADGIHQITVRQFDAAGNMSGDSSALSITVDNAGPSAGTWSLNFSGGPKFALPFSEAIVFQPGGSFNLFQGGTQRDSYWGNNHSGWSVSADADGELAVLNFNISLTGLLRMQWNHGSVTDLAGNAAIVGVSGWDFEMPGSA
ncbi:MAG: Ig-like domain-containing protein, partial [Pseudomonadota bacterium]